MKNLTARDLSDRELEVLQLAAEGMENKVIARTMDLSEATVKVHMKAVLRKLQAGNRTHGVVIAFRRGIIPLEYENAADGI